MNVTIPPAPEPGLDAAINATKSCSTFSFMDALSIYNDKHEPPPEIWGGLQLDKNQIMEIIGPAGIGKSRLMLNLAVNQILGRKFAGLDVYVPKNEKDAINWLFIGNENSFFRYRNDLRKMLGNLTEPELQKFSRHLFLPTMNSITDGYIALDTEENRDRVLNTIIASNASVVVLDPWGAVISGDELSDRDVRHSIILLSEILLKADDKLKHPVTAIIINHSLNSLKKLASACGPECGDYGKNSKAIFSVVRVVWNLRPGSIDSTTHSNLIELINAKCNDEEKLDPICVKLTPETMTYEVEPNFDHASFQRQLLKISLNQTALYKNACEATAEKATNENRAAIIAHLESLTEPEYKGDFDKWAKKNLKNCGKTPQDIYKELINSGEISVLSERKPGGKDLVWITKKMQVFFDNAPPSTYKIKGGGVVAKDNSAQ